MDEIMRAIKNGTIAAYSLGEISSSYKRRQCEKCGRFAKSLEIMEVKIAIDGQRFSCSLNLCRRCKNNKKGLKEAAEKKVMKEMLETIGAISRKRI